MSVRDSMPWTGELASSVAAACASEVDSRVLRVGVTGCRIGFDEAKESVGDSGLTDRRS